MDKSACIDKSDGQSESESEGKKERARRMVVGESDQRGEEGRWKRANVGECIRNSSKEMVSLFQFYICIPKSERDINQRNKMRTSTKRKRSNDLHIFVFLYFLPTREEGRFCGSD